ncbi:hypothetical protein PTTG_03919 [Puccinia triticina 1-1 BBBD Race 1]|uniref:tRNA ligase kinase domain-containing protein n=2 Tax=Puccinia triticina TaxID=208348 RepID=A0A0C4ESZ0_PUCT1|nr:uncharacterized protein PtA15_14A485 [Puccinia triticina]OAV92317.1 hypothetical protein PTTG_03919 [Puccinia triticina 1-1 BBBD Race 1]WAQ91601.1 hypothetical protein PtA15_14A485 [Puccinia triticina]WAR62406.1 hypothetical protein PtB15_14B501 [Puccinia triticina]
MADLSQPERTPDKPPRILVLSGWVGSGKSTFATQLENSDPNFVRICQDVLGKRQACEAMARRSLKEGKSIIIDRQNFDPKQRRTWIRIGQEFDQLQPPGTQSVDCDLIEFATPFEECARRLRARTGHETIHSVREGMGILNVVANKEWVAPQISEGFTRHLVLRPGAASCQAQQPASAPVATIPFPVTPQVVRSILATLDSIPPPSSARAPPESAPPTATPLS